MKPRRRLRIYCPLLVVLIAVPALGGDSPGEPEPKPAANAEKQATPHDTLRVSYPFKFASESTYSAWVSRRADTLEAAATGAPGVPRRIELLLAAANRLLSSGTEHAATTRILAVEQDEMPDLDAVGNLIQRAESLLDRADQLIQQHNNDTADTDKESQTAQKVWRELSMRSATIRSFAMALHAYLLDTGSDGDAQSKRHAASKLSGLLESDSVPIASAARLWQALLRSDERDSSRALSIIGPVTAPPLVGSQPYRFFGAILRAKLLAKHRSPTLALAMLMRVEELVDAWFSGQRNRGQALRTSAFVRVEIMQDWAEALSQKKGYDQEVAWCQERILTLQEDWLTGEMPRLLRLSPAIPLLVQPKDLGVDDPKPVPKQPNDQ